MDRPAVIKGIKAAISEVLKHETSDVTEDTLLFEELYLDSTAILELLMALEDTLGIEVDPETLDLATFRTLGTLADYVCEALRPNGESAYV